MHKVLGTQIFPEFIKLECLNFPGPANDCALSFRLKMVKHVLWSELLAYKIDNLEKWVVAHGCPCSSCSWRIVHKELITGCKQRKCRRVLLLYISVFQPHLRIPYVQTITLKALSMVLLFCKNCLIIAISR